MRFFSLLVIFFLTQLSISTPIQAKSKDEMCQIADKAIAIISIKLGDSKEVTADKVNLVHAQCINTTISELEETYQYLIENWDVIFDEPLSN